MESHEVKINNTWYRVTKIDDSPTFDVEHHTGPERLGWLKLIRVKISEDEWPNIDCCVQEAIESFLENETDYLRYTKEANPAAALEIICRYGSIDGDHHKQWVLDQVTRLLTGSKYEEFVVAACDGEDGPRTYSWEEGIAP